MRVNAVWIWFVATRVPGTDAFERGPREAVVVVVVYDQDAVVVVSVVAPDHL